MQITINDTVKEVPFSLSLITLRQYIDYYEKYGSKLELDLLEIHKREYTDDDLQKYIDKKALAWYSYWTGYDLFEVAEEPFIEPLLKQYRILYELLQDEDDLIKNFGSEIEWNGETWCMSDFKDCSLEEMSYNQISILRTAFRHIQLVKKNKWDAMIYLCAVFFRKKGENVNDILNYKDLFTSTKLLENEYFTNGIRISEQRVQLLKDLPMNYVVSVKLLVSSITEAEEIFKTTVLPSVIIAQWEQNERMGEALKWLETELKEGKITPEQFADEIKKAITPVPPKQLEDQRQLKEVQEARKALQKKTKTT